jgi:hypothetical protein
VPCNNQCRNVPACLRRGQVRQGSRIPSKLVPTRRGRRKARSNQQLPTGRAHARVLSPLCMLLLVAAAAARIPLLIMTDRWGL